MREVQIRNNSLGLKVFIDEFPDISLMPASELDLLITDLELAISNYAKKKRCSKVKKSGLKQTDIPP